MRYLATLLLIAFSSVALGQTCAPSCRLSWEYDKSVGAADPVTTGFRILVNGFNAWEGEATTVLCSALDNANVTPLQHNTTYSFTVLAYGPGGTGNEISTATFNDADDNVISTDQPSDCNYVTQAPTDTPDDPVVEAP